MQRCSATSASSGSSSSRGQPRSTHASRSDACGRSNRLLKGGGMYARVVRFTEVDPDHLAERLADAEGSDGPPVDIPVKGIQILHDSDQRTAVVIQLFETADDMAAAGTPRRDGPGRHAGEACLDRPLRNQGRTRGGVT